MVCLGSTLESTPWWWNPGGTSSWSCIPIQEEENDKGSCIFSQLPPFHAILVYQRKALPKTRVIFPSQ